MGVVEGAEGEVETDVLKDLSMDCYCCCCYPHPKKKTIPQSIREEKAAENAHLINNFPS